MTGDYTVYIWDHRNRLVSVIEMDCDGTPTSFGDDFSTREVDYGYDAQNQLVWRAVDTDGSTGNDSLRQTVWLWQNGQIVLQFDGLGDYTDYEGRSHRYLWGPAVDMLLADEAVDYADFDPDGVVHWTLTDHLGTVRDVVYNNGTVIDHAEYDAFGKRLDAAVVDVVFGFTGKLFDEYIGAWYHRNRWLESDTARWLSEDPIGFAAGDPNLGRYVGNSPTMFTDPYGLDYTSVGGGPSVPIEQLGSQSVPWWIMPTMVGLPKLTPEEMGPPRWPKNGVWSGQPGNSWFRLTPKSTPIYFVNGFPDFSSVPGAIHSKNGRRTEVKIELDKSEINVKDKKALKAELRRRHDADVRKANKKMAEILGRPDFKPPKGYAWHHVDSSGWMQLVKEKYHKLAHRGGANLNFRELVKAGKVKVGGVKGKITGGKVVFGLSIVIVIATSDNEGDFIDALNPIGGSVANAQTISNPLPPWHFHPQPSEEEWEKLGLQQWAQEILDEAMQQDSYFWELVYPPASGQQNDPYHLLRPPGYQSPNWRPQRMPYYD